MTIQERAEQQIQKQMCGSIGYDPTCGHCETALNDLEQCLLAVRKEAIEHCIKCLGGRYGAQATKDLRALAEKIFK